MNNERFDPMAKEFAHDPARDPVLGALLREERLGERIRVLARARHLRRADTPWYGWVAQYARTAIPLGIAAALIAAVLLNRSVRLEAELAAQTVATDLRGAVTGGSRLAVTDAVVGPDSTEFLIAMAVDR